MTKLHMRTYTQKDWFRNMDNIVVNYRHRGEENHMYLIHMLGKCRIDRLGGVSKVYRGDCR